MPAQAHSGSGKVYLVGAGPGDPGLLTLRGAQVLERADVVIYDRLVHPTLLRRARPCAEMVYAGKESGRHTIGQEEINALLVAGAREGKVVVRLKGGDPFVFGRGGEEAEALAEAGIEFEVVPGVTSATAVPAYAGIPVTHRKLCSSLGIVTGHEDPLKPETSIRWDLLSDCLDTLVLLMGVENLPSIVSKLMENGRPPYTPVAVIRWGTRANQQTLVGSLADIARKVEKANLGSPAVTIIGEVVNLREKLQWFEKRPLFGKRVVVTRSREQAGTLSERLLELGAEVIEFPAIRIQSPSDLSDLDAAIAGLQRFDWIVFTSANGVQAFFRRLRESGQDSRAVARAKLGAIGPMTAEALEGFGLKADYVPSEFVAEAVVREFPESAAGKRILIPRAAQAREAMPEGLRELGAEVRTVTAYETVVSDSDVSEMRRMLERGEVDVLTFASSSTVANFVRLVGKGGKIDLPEKVKVACIGPITAQTAREYGLEPDTVAEDYTIDGLIESLLAVKD